MTDKDHLALLSKAPKEFQGEVNCTYDYRPIARSLLTNAKMEGFTAREVVVLARLLRIIRRFA